MVSFRFHIVSLIAVFLALALGIGMGVTVIDKATVDLLQRRLDSVRNEVNAANERSDGLDRLLARSNEYEQRAAEYLVARRLEGVPVVVVGVRGVDQGPLNEVRKILTEAGGVVQGTLWITDKMRLDDQGDIADLASELGLSSLEKPQVRQAFLVRLNAALAGASDVTTLEPLIDEGFLDWEGDRVGDIARVDLSAARLVVASGATPVVANEDVAIPLLRMLAAQPIKRVVVVESGDDGDHQRPARRAVFAGPVRSDSSLDEKLSTVDHVELSSGRVATVLALSQLASGRTGDYGYGGSTDGAIPKLDQ